MIANPEAWELPYEAAMNYLLNRKDAPDARRQAAFYLALSAATGNAPQLVTDVAAKLGAEQELGTIERDMWKSLLESPDSLLRDMAERKLKEMEVREAVKVLNQGVQIFREKTGRPPASLQEMQEVGLLKVMPPDPLGGRYFLDENGAVQNTTLLDDLKSHYSSLIQGALDRFKKNTGGPPQTLEELVTQGYMSKLPPDPYPNETWLYDPESGMVK